jgi:hypothetical protein
MSQILTVSMGLRWRGRPRAERRVRRRDWVWASMIEPIGVTAAGQDAAEQGQS